MTDAPEDLGAVTSRKLARVFGDDRARALLKSVLVEVRLDAVRTVDDLERVASALEGRGGFEATAGTMLSVLAAMRRLDVPATRR